MKKIFALILAVLCLGTSTGATVRIHYCGGKLADVQLWPDNSNKCAKCTPVVKKSCNKKCCRDEHKTVKLEKDQKLNDNNIQLIQLPALTVQPQYASLPPVQVVHPARAYPSANAPPYEQKISSYILHCTFRI
ncbi:hypothetical protein CLV59_104457 [Chitinophaga dinghuensis]|uniref:Uncharacterized protein n=1 Tax=Chitinophaga dinghuensis TaxID=1539050 RepID=A0A327W0E6_9BACT|nr:hypothetical protein [Chitinophaga dinghuensis]RAJ82232.1 hypothetical protein CLV59_104457 [Chitinophaga dinghuensis]